MTHQLTLVDAVARHAGSTPSRLAIVDGDARITYSQLWQMVEDEAQRLRQEGVSKGQLVLVRGNQHVSFLVTCLAVHRLGAVVAPVGSDLPQQQFDALHQCCHDAALDEDIADVLFTTGTMGQQKGVMVSHTALLSDAENLIDAQGFTADTVFVITGPLSHIGSLSKTWPVLLLGGTLILLDGMRDLDAFFKAMAWSTGLLATFLVPTAIDMVLRFGQSRLAALANRIDFIETGAAAISEPTLQALCTTLPSSRLFNTYASTETGIVCTHDFNHGLRDPRCLGRPMKHAHVRITDDGRIACRGDMVMTGYLGQPALTRERFSDGWLVTDDLGEKDADGRLHFKGRQGEIINVGGYKVSPIEVEQAARGVPGIADCVLVAAQLPLGTVLKLIYTSDSGQPLDHRVMARQLAAQLERYKVPMCYEHVASLHYTFNGKVDRKAYR